MEFKGENQQEYYITYKGEVHIVEGTDEENVWILTERLRDRLPYMEAWVSIHYKPEKDKGYKYSDALYFTKLKDLTSNVLYIRARKEHDMVR
jgi:hypothetical protein